MRQVKKARIVFFIIGLLLGCILLGGLGFTMISSRDKQIAELENLKADGKMWAFARNISADSPILSEDDIVELETKVVNFANGGYYAEKTVLDGKEKWQWKHYLVDENGKQSKKSTSKSELVGRIVKANVSKNEPIMDSLLYEPEGIPTKSERWVDYNFLQLPSDLKENDYVDIRIQFPTGEDYVVLVGKKVKLPDLSNDALQNSNTIFLKLDEDEQLAMASAIIENYMDKGVRLYARKYSDPATQLYNESIVDFVKLYDEYYKQAKANISRQGAPTYNESGELIPGNSDRTEPSDEDIVYLSKMDTANPNITLSIVQAIRELRSNNDENSLAYYKQYRLQESTKIVSTYPLKKEVLNVVRTNPNIISDILAEYEAVNRQNTREDELERLRAKYESAKTAAELSMYGTNTSGIETKESIYEQIRALEKERKKNIEDNLEVERNTQRSERISYLQRLLGSSSSN